MSTLQKIMTEAEEEEEEKMDTKKQKVHCQRADGTHGGAVISPYFGDGTGLDTGREDGKLRRGGGRTLKHKFLQITEPTRELIIALKKHHTNTATET